MMMVMMMMVMVMMMMMMMMVMVMHSALSTQQGLHDAPPSALPAPPCRAC